MALPAAPLPETTSASRLLVYAALFTLAAFALDVLAQPRYPASLPAVGHGRGVLAWFRNVTGYFAQHHRWTQDGYDKYSKYGRAFILPSSAARPADIVLPRDQTAWLMDQPESAVSAPVAHNKVMHARYNFLGARLADDGLHARVVHRHLTRHLPGLIPDIADEVRAAMDDAFAGAKGQKKEVQKGAAAATLGWAELNLWDAFIHVVPRVTNRVLVGPELCRNDSFLASMVAVADVSVRNCFILAVLPRLFHPLAARIATIPNRRHWRAAHAAARPVIEARLHGMLSPDNAARAAPPPEDFITWTIRQALAEGSAFDLRPDVISKRLLPVEFAAIHTTVLTLHSLVLDILSSPDREATVAAIVDEARAALASTPGGEWTKSALHALVRTDSAVRESQRLSNFHSTLVERIVVAPGGVHNPAEGWTAPPGAWLTLNLTGLHHDEALHAGAGGYDAFRYARMRDALQEEAATKGADGADALVRSKRLGMVTTSDAHLAFGHGRHACPGRFFVAHEIKMIVAHLFTHYDVQPTGARPQPMWLGATIVPPLGATIRVRRKEKAG